ncbi:PREDICTED: protein Wnt-16 [Charadrius vociferus]|uniref:protein Wnt-16 n=1 Tax=Charadrius vociferus TaxID=50402 RepID=UPI00052131B3|nr:PREDICTED: protein Wnt-16 [Charadrius vociferus]
MACLQPFPAARASSGARRTRRKGSGQRKEARDGWVGSGLPRHKPVFADAAVLRYQFPVTLAACGAAHGELRYSCAIGHEVSSGTKETAFIYAVTSAGLVHSVTRSCSAGNMTECSCDTSLRHGGSASEGWHWGGCSDDIHYGMSFSRKFLDVPIKNVTGKSGSGLAAMNRHNNEAGRQAVAKLMSVDCRCHGVSGSCAVKTCWKTMSSFEKIGRFLKDKYENSIQISDRLKKKLRRKEKSQRKIPIGKEDLLYVNKSPNYCVEDQKLGIPGTQGRECNRTSEGPDGCNLLCCGRGYNTHVVRHVERCECKFVWCCYVRCRRCETMTDVHTCK